MKTWWQGKRVMVTGAAGFIGSHAVDMLAEWGAKVTAVISPRTPDLKVDSNLVNSRTRIAVIRADLVDPKSCHSITQQQDAVLHFAAVDGGSEFKKTHSLRILEANTSMTRNLLHSVATTRTTRFLLMSSIEVYLKGLVPLRAGLPPQLPSAVVDGYAWSKRFSEILAQLYRQTYGFPLTIVRAGNVYGPRDYLDVEKGRVIPMFIRNSLQEKRITIFGDGSQERTFLFVTDFLTTVLGFLPDHDSAEPLTIAASASISIRDLANKVLQLTGSQSSITHVGNQQSQSPMSVIELPKAAGISEDTELTKGLMQTIEDIRGRLEANSE